MQVNMLEAKTELSKLVKMLENNKEQVIYLARSGKPIVQMTLIPPKKEVKRIGIAEGAFKIPKDFDKWDDEINSAFGEEL